MGGGLILNFGPVHLSDFEEVVWRNLRVQSLYGTLFSPGETFLICLVFISVANISSGCDKFSKRTN